MIVLSIMNKAEKDIWLPQLFDLLYENMKNIAPSQQPYGQEREEWLAEVSRALEKAPRQIVLCMDGDTIAGFVQYYTREDLLMIEEIQLRKQYQRTLLFYSLCKYFVGNIADQISCVEAYADKRNLYSQRIMAKLGMTVVDEMKDTPFLLFHATAERITEKFFRPF